MAHTKKEGGGACYRQDSKVQNGLNNTESEMQPILQHLGSMVTINCGQLGHYQGRVKDINLKNQELTIEDVFQHGRRYEKDEVTFSAAVIEDLAILMDPVEAAAHAGRRATPCKQIREPEPTRYGDGSPVPIVGNYKSVSPVQPAQVNGQGGRNGYSRLTPTHRTPTREVDGRNSRNAAPNNRSRKPATPNKSEGAKNRRVREDAFAEDVSSYRSTEFDFEGNNAKFNKASVFKEIEDQNRQTEMVKAGERPTKYRHDEMVLATQAAKYQQIKVPEKVPFFYTTDAGLEVPAISTKLRQRLLDAARGKGFDDGRLVEIMGRSACEKVMDLVGGTTRLTPENKHQRPNVTVLCGQHLQGAMGVNCARHLANHGVQTRLFIQEMMRFVPYLKKELDLYNLCGGTRISLNEIEDKPHEKTDLVVVAIQGHGDDVLLSQQWVVTAISKAAALNSQYLAIDPPSQEPVLPARWYLCAGLPLAYRLPSKAQPPKILLCDLGLPPRVFRDVDIEYESPFSSKFIIPLDPK